MFSESSAVVQISHCASIESPIIPVHPEAPVKALVQHDPHGAGDRLLDRAEGQLQIAAAAARGRLGEMSEHEVISGDVQTVEGYPWRLAVHLSEEAN